MKKKPVKSCKKNGRNQHDFITSKCSIAVAYGHSTLSAISKMPISHQPAGLEDTAPLETLPQSFCASAQN